MSSGRHQKGHWRNGRITMRISDDDNPHSLYCTINPWETEQQFFLLLKKKKRGGTMIDGYLMTKKKK